MKKVILTTLSAFLLGTIAQASVSVSLDIGTLYGTSTSSIFPDGGLVQLIASPLDSNFLAPTPGNFVNGDDIVLASFGLDSATAGGISGANSNVNVINFSGDLGVGDGLALRWYPTLKVDSPVVAGNRYGQFTDSSWVLPSDGGSIGLQFLNVASGAGTFANSLAVSTGTVVPEPSTYAAILGLATLGLVGFRRFRR